MPRRLLQPLLLALILAPAASAAPAASQPKPLFSEDFESGTIDKNLWTQDVTGDAILTVQSDKVAHGKYALLARCPAPAMRTHAILMAHNLPEPLRHHHFGRAYVYITPVTPDRHTVFITAGTSGFPKSKFFEVATAHANFQTTFTNGVDGGEDWHPGQPPSRSVAGSSSSGSSTTSPIRKPSGSTAKRSWTRPSRSKAPPPTS